jgi:hypothetical protein
MSSFFFCLKLVFNWLENKKLTRIQNNPKPQSNFFFFLQDKGKKKT